MAKFATQQEFAKALGVSEGTLSKYLRRGDWPARREAPFGDADLEKARGLQKLLQDDRSEKAAPPAAAVRQDVNLKELQTRQKILLDKERTRKARVEADLAEAQVVPRALLDDAVIGLARIFVERIRNAESALPRFLDGDKRKNKAALSTYFERVRQDLVESASIELAKADDELRKIVTRKGRASSRARAAGEAAAE